MATFVMLSSPVSMVGIRTGIKRRFRSPSPDPERFRNPLSLDSIQEFDPRPRKTRKLRERQTPVIPAVPFKAPITRPFNTATQLDEILDVEDAEIGEPISPAAFSQAMDVVLMEQDQSQPSHTPTFTESPQFIPPTVAVTGSTPPPALAAETCSQPDWWFPMGDIVLGVENMMFRVHKRVLAEHSSVFEDMFTLSEPARGSDSDNVEETPRVQLHDCAQDWIETFSWLYTGSPSYNLGDLERIPFSTIKSHLTISNKYDMPVLRAHSQTALEHLYRMDILRFCSPLRDPSPVTANSLSALLLAHQCDIPKALPGALYHVLTSHTNERAPLLSVDLRKGYYATQTVLRHLKATLSIPRSMLPPKSSPNNGEALNPLPRQEFSHADCYDRIERRWKSCLTRYVVEEDEDLRLETHFRPRVIPLLEALRGLERKTYGNEGDKHDCPCQTCNLPEAMLADWIIMKVLEALPWWFGFS